MVATEFYLANRFIELKFVLDQASSWSLSLKRTPDEYVSFFVVEEDVGHKWLGGGRHEFVCWQRHLVYLATELRIIFHV